MKKILMATNLLLVGVILFISCNDSTTNTPIALNSPQAICSARMCKDYSNVDLAGIINGELLQSMSEAYAADLNKSRVNFNPDNPGASAPDALSVCFNLEKLKNFIWYIENATCRSGCDSLQELGIRFYYIKYPAGLDTSAVPPDLEGLFSNYANRHSLAMVPVYKAANGEWYDFDYTNLGSDCKFNPIRIVALKNLVAPGLLVGSGENHGGIGPPPEPGTYPTSQ